MMRCSTVRSIPPWMLDSSYAILVKVLLTLWAHPKSVIIGTIVYIAIIVAATLPLTYCVPDPTANRTAEGEDLKLCLTGDSFWTVSLLWGSLLLMVNEVPTDLVMLCFTLLLVLSGTITNSEAWEGFSSTSVLSIGALFIVARCIEETRAVELALRPILGTPSGHVSALLRLCVPVAFLSAWMNNTPIVAMLIGVCESWAARANLSIKVLLIPLSFSAILGGACTLIGTSTNLILNSQIEADPDPPLPPLSMFTLTPVGAPAAVVGILYLAIFTPLVFRERAPRAAHAGTQEAAAAAQACAMPSGTMPSGTMPSGTMPSGAMPSSAVPSVPSGALEAPPPTGVVCGAKEGSQRFGSRGSPRYTMEVLLGAECASLVGASPSALSEVVSASLRARVLVRRGQAHPVHDRREHDDWRLAAGDVLVVSGLADAMEALRHVPGLTLRPDAPLRATPSAATPSAATPSAATRAPSGVVLVEATLAGGTPLVGLPLRTALLSDGLRGTDVWAIRTRHTHDRRTAPHTTAYDTVPHLSPLPPPPLPGSVPKGSSVHAPPKGAPAPPKGAPAPHAPKGAPTPHAAARHAVRSLAHAVRSLADEDSELSTVGVRRDGLLWFRDAKVLIEPSRPSSPHASSPHASSPHASSPHASSPHASSPVPSAAESAAESLRESGVVCSGARSARLRAGDTLLLEASDCWLDAHRQSRFFVRVERVGRAAHGAAHDGPLARDGTSGGVDRLYEGFKLIASVAGLAVMLTLSALDVVNLFPLALTVGGCLIALGCITLDEARAAVNVRVLLTIAMAFGPGAALADTNVAAVLGAGLAELAVIGSFGFLYAIFLFSSTLSCVTSHAASVITFYSVLRDLRVEGVSTTQTMVAMIVGASCTFITPLGYQTNLMVLGRGGYAFRDFILLGGGLTLAVGATVAGCCIAFLE